MKNTNNRRDIILALNFLIILGEVFGLFLRTYILQSPGLEFYTVVSNYVSLFASLAVVHCIVTKRPISRPAKLLRLAATIMLTVTFLVVIFILPGNLQTPLWQLLFPGQMFFLHLICPILSIVTLLIFERYRFSRLEQDVVTLPTIIYALFIIIANLADVVNGPYPFIRQLMSDIVATLLAVVACYLLPRIMAAIFSKITAHTNLRKR